MRRGNPQNSPRVTTKSNYPVSALNSPVMGPVSIRRIIFFINNVLGASEPMKATPSRLMHNRCLPSFTLNETCSKADISDLMPHSTSSSCLTATYATPLVQTLPSVGTFKAVTSREQESANRSRLNSLVSMTFFCLNDRYKNTQRETTDPVDDGDQ